MYTKDLLNDANPNLLADMFHGIGLGQILRGQLPQVIRLKTPVASASQLVTLASFTLPTDCKAATIDRAYARATTAGGTLGELAIQAINATPGDAQIAVAPNGDIVVLLASAYNGVDVVFQPCRGDVVVLDAQEVVANVFALPASVTAKGVIYLTQVEATVAGAIGVKVVLAPAAGAPAAGQARLNLAKTTVTFPAADAVTRCKVTLLVGSTLDLDTILEATV